MADVSEAAEASSSGSPFRAFKSANYTYFWIASLLSINSFFMLLIARGWLVFQMTDSPFIVTVVAAAAQLPSLVLSVFGGVIADRFNRKKVLLINEVSNFAILLLLAILVVTDTVAVWHIIVLGVINGVTFSLAFPARAAIVPSLVPPRDVANGVALSSIMFSGAQLIGPAVAGLLIGVSPALAFFVAAGSVGAGIPLFLLLKLRPMGWEGKQVHDSVIGSILEGARYIRSQHIVMGLMVLGFVVVVFGMPYQTMLPVFAEEILEAGPQGLGLLGAFGGIGAIAGSLAIATFSSVNQMKVFLAAGALGLGVFIILFGLSSIFVLSLVMALLAGFFFQLVMTANFALLQVLVPDRLRGRVLSVRFIVFGMSPAGIISLGIAAERVGTPMATAGIGAITLAGSILTLAVYSGLRRRGAPMPFPVEEQVSTPNAS